MGIINLDHLAYSPVLPEAKELVMSFLSTDTGNPLSRHVLGDKSKIALEEARKCTADLIGAKPEEMIFASCGSEANNLAIKGLAGAYAKKGRHVIASPIEHHSIIHPLKNLEKQGYMISWLKVDEKGFVDPAEVAALIREDTILVSVTSASNEIGTLEPIEEVGKITRARGVPLHTDAVACAGMVEMDVNKLNVDLLSMAGNVFYGPPGTGALYVRKGIKIMPLIEGGVQEMGLRAGTHNIAGIAGMGLAAKIAKASLQERQRYLIKLRDRMIEGTLHGVSDSFLTGDRSRRLPAHASFCIKFIEGESILLHLNFALIAGTSGSTCSSEALKVSHVLGALGIDPVWAQGSCVFTLGIDNTDDDIELFLKELVSAVENLRRMSPLTASNINELKKMKHEEEERAG